MFIKQTAKVSKKERFIGNLTFHKHLLFHLKKKKPKPKYHNLSLKNKHF